MSNDLRKNPRFLASDGIPATITVVKRTLSGTLHNFSSTGFALVVNDTLEDLHQTPIVVSFIATSPNKELSISALVTNQMTNASATTRLGCQITDMKDHTETYFGFLTTLLGKQGLLMSMAKKPVKVASQSQT